MSRRVISTQLQRTTAADIDTYFDRVIKYIPADIIAAWTTATGLITSANNVPTNKVLWIAFAAGLILTPLWTLKQTAKPGLPPARMQTVIATGAFLVWVFALGGPFVTLGFYRPLYGSLLLMLYTLVVGLIEP